MKLVFLIVAAVVLGGCAQPQHLAAFSVGGSKSDGVVEMVHDTSPPLQLQPNTIDWVATQRDAENKCRLWGYKSANRFDGHEIVCAQMSAGSVSCNLYSGCITIPPSCEHTQTRIRYQCY